MVPGDDLKEKVNDKIKLSHFYQDIVTSSSQDLSQQRTDKFYTSNVLGTYHACLKHNNNAQSNFKTGHIADATYVTLNHPISLPHQKICPFLWVDLEPYLVHSSLDSPNPPPQMTSQLSLPFSRINSQSLKQMDKQTERQNGQGTRPAPIADMS